MKLAFWRRSPPPPKPVDMHEVLETSMRNLSWGWSWPAGTAREVAAMVEGLPQHEAIAIMEDELVRRRISRWLGRDTFCEGLGI